ncbi:MAG: hypothetical protein PHP00_11230 [Thiotrichaceae bacterium]|nr:hypothetical protein [Thiotrichaceae bacterium]
MSKNTGFLQDDSGNLSSMRLAFLLWVVGVLTIWGVASLKTGELKVIPDSVTTIIGLLMGGKVMQKFGEQSTPQPAENAQSLIVQAPPAGHNPNIDPIVVPTIPIVPVTPVNTPQVFG